MSYYGQKNYNEMLGAPALYRIAQAGCFMVGFCNGLQKDFGIGVDPIALNNAFKERHIYVDAPPKDGAYDDLYYEAVTAAYPQIVVTGKGKGRPPSNAAMVKFYYKSKTTGQMTTHFCWVNDEQAGTIIDSWDGGIKSWDVYGGPIEYATYGRAGGVQVEPVHPVSTPAPAPASPGGDYSVVTPVKGYSNSNNAANHINWNGSTMIQPGGYSIFNQTHGMINVTSKPGVAGSWINPADNVAPAPAPEPAPAPAVDPNILEVQPGWGISHCLYNRGYPKDEYSSADKWQWVANLNGVADWHDFRLKPYQKIICPPYSAPAPTLAPAEPAPAAPIEAPVPAEPEPTPAVPDFTATYVEQPGKYVCIKAVEVSDIKNPEAPLLTVPLGHVNMAGYFYNEGAKYYRSHHHAETGEWYGVPEDALRPLKDGTTVEAPKKPVDDKEDDDIFAAVLDDFNLKEEVKEFATNLTGRKRVLAIVGTIIGFMERLKFWKNKKG